MTTATKRIAAQVKKTVTDWGRQLSALNRLPRWVRAIRYLEVDSYTDLLHKSKPSILWLYEPQALPQNKDLLFAHCANKNIRADHLFSGPPPPKVGLACISNVFLNGQSLVGTSWAIYQLDPVTPLYIDLILNKNTWSDGTMVGRRRLRKSSRFMPGLSVLITHWNSDVYGHWLLECLPKLLLLRRLTNQLPTFRIVLPLSTAPWILTWIGSILPNVHIETFDNTFEYLRCEKLLLPTMLLCNYFHPVLNELVDELSHSSNVEASGCSALYVSRVVQSCYRELSNRMEIEDIAVSEGLTLVRPETLSISDQIALFANAHVLVGEFGSAMHNALFSPPGTKVLCLNWINGLQSRIAQLRQHQLGYLLPSDGVPVEHIDGAARRTYHIDPQKFRQCVRTLLEKN